MLFLALRRGWLRAEEISGPDWTPEELLARLESEGRLTATQLEELSHTVETETRLSTLSSDAPPIIKPKTAAFLPRASAPVEGEPWGAYSLITLLGEGGMGRVYQAWDPKLARMVALKILQHTDATLKERFFLEAKAQARVDHPNVAKVYEVGDERGQPYIAMQLIEGWTLRDAATALRLEEKISVLRQACEGVHAAHRLGVIHRDLKPSNILVERMEDGSWNAVVMDFGIAWTLENQGLTRVGQTLGTPQYMSPEHARGMELDRRSDVYSLGVTMFEVLCERLPFSGDNLVEIIKQLEEQEPPKPTELVKDLPRDLETIVLKAMDKIPTQRFESARAMGEDLQRFLDGEPIMARASTLKERALRWVRRHRVASAALMASLLATLTVGGASGWALLRNRRQARAAQAFTREADLLERLLSRVYGLPAHDVGPDEFRVRQAMLELIDRNKKNGGATEGPGQVAMGRVQLALGDLDAAHQAFQSAWDLGYRTDELAFALGSTKARLYQAKLESVSGSDREERKKDLESSLRQPAIQLLRNPKAVQLDSPDLARGYLALTESKYEEALRFAAQARQAQPWLFEAWLLESEVELSRATEASEGNRRDEAISALNAAADAVAQARNIGRSAPSVYLMTARVEAEGLRIRIQLASADEKDLDRALTACRAALEIRPDSWQAWERQAAIYLYWAPQLRILNRPGEANLDEGIRAAEKSLELRPESGEALTTLGSLWWRRAQVDQLGDRDPRPALNASIAAIAQALRRPEFAHQLFHKLGNAYTTLALFEIRRGADARASATKAVENYRESLKLKPKASVQSDLVWGLNVAASVESYAGRDPSELLVQARREGEGALEKSPKYFFALGNLAESDLLDANHQLFKGKDPSQAIDQARAHARRAIAERPNFRIAQSALGQASLLAARADVLAGRDPSSSLGDALVQFRRALEISPGHQESSRDLLTAEVEAFRWRFRQKPDAKGYADLLKEAKRLEKSFPSDAELVMVEARLHAYASLREGRGQARDTAMETMTRSLRMNRNLQRQAREIRDLLQAKKERA
jgi:eukaryotic-like serine/threonine-protein kinase